MNDPLDDWVKVDGVPYKRREWLAIEQRLANNDKLGAMALIREALARAAGTSFLPASPEQVAHAQAAVLEPSVSEKFETFRREQEGLPAAIPVPAKARSNQPASQRRAERRKAEYIQ